MIETQKLPLPYALDPVSLYRALCAVHGDKNTVLLESADVHTKNGEKSFLMAKAALKIQAQREFVKVKAFSAFGEFLLEKLVAHATLEIAEHTKQNVAFAIPRSTEDESLSAQLQRKSCFDVLRDIMKLHSLAPQAAKSHFLTAGILSYDLIDHFENLPEAKTDIHGFADYVFWFPECFVEIDHIHKKTQVVQHRLGAADDFVASTVLVCEKIKADQKKAENLNGDPQAIENAAVDISDADFEKLVEKLKGHVIDGDVFQIVPSRVFSVACPDPLLAYEYLKIINPSPYMYYVVDEDFKLLGASPETFVKLDALSRIVDVKPIAGTRRRGFAPNGRIDLELDGRLEAELRLDTKELAEHMMLVDLARNDIARVSKLGTRHVHRLLNVERYSHVMHLVSQVRGELAVGLDGLHAYQASMNMGTLVGAPKVKAMELLRMHENSKRGTYGGAIGYMDAAGNFDTAIIIRSAFIKDEMAYVRAGAGVVYDSVPTLEAAETKSKASAVVSALTLALAHSKGGAHA